VGNTGAELGTEGKLGRVVGVLLAMETGRVPVVSEGSCGTGLAGTATAWLARAALRSRRLRAALLSESTRSQLRTSSSVSA
jgi:hypothetical protein